MNQADKEKATGYLTVKVSTAGGVLPLEGATINIRGQDAEDSGILYSLRTDPAGRTGQVALEAPNPSLSASPGSISPFTSYRVDVFKEGYVPLFFNQVPVFPGIISVQPAIMVPLTGGEGEF